MDFLTKFFPLAILRLEELRIDDNLLTGLPNTLKLLRNLKSISVSNNKISKLPDFMTAMRFNNGVVSVVSLAFLWNMFEAKIFSGLFDSEPTGFTKEWHQGRKRSEDRLQQPPTEEAQPASEPSERKHHLGELHCKPKICVQSRWTHFR